MERRNALRPARLAVGILNTPRQRWQLHPEELARNTVPFLQLLQSEDVPSASMSEEPDRDLAEAAQEEAEAPLFPNVSRRPRSDRGHPRAQLDSAPTSSDSGASPASGSGGASAADRSAGDSSEPADVAARRRLALQAKNRRAQRRFRLKNLDILVGLQAKHSALFAEVRALQEEYAAELRTTAQMQQQVQARQLLLHTLQGNRQAQRDFMLGIGALDGMLPVPNGHACPSVEEIRRLSPDQMSDTYQAYAHALSAGLAERSTGAGAAAGVERLADTLGTFLLRLSAARPMEASHFITLSRQHMTTEPEAFCMWRAVVQQLDLTDEQRQDVRYWHRQYLEEMQSVRQRSLETGATLLSCLPTAVFSTSTAQEYIAVSDALSQHTYSLRAEHIAYLKLFVVVCMCVLTRSQFAALVVRSFPVVPDALGVVAGMVAEVAATEQAVPDMAQVMPAVSAGSHTSVAPPLLGSAAE